MVRLTYAGDSASGGGLLNAFWWSLLAVWVVFNFLQSLDAAQEASQGWSSIPGILASVDCARITGQFLIVCPEVGAFGVTENVPLGAIVSADDPGVPLFLGVFSWVTGHEVSPPEISIMNTVINYLGIAVLAGIFLWKRFFILGSVTLVLLPLLSNVSHQISPHPAAVGLICLAMILPLAISNLILAKQVRFPDVIFLLCGLVGLVVATLYRQPVGMIAFFVSVLLFLAYVYIQVKKRKPAGFLGILGLAGVIVAAWSGPRFLFRFRDFAYSLNTTGQIEQHGIWHSMYGGLGAVDNSFGISWDDTVIASHVNRVDPNIVYASQDYFEVLKSLYLETVFKYPIEVLLIYVEKFKITINGRLFEGSPALGWWIILTLSFLLVTVLISKPREWGMLEFVALVSFLVMVGFFAQSVFIIWDPLYARPLAVPLIVLFGCSLEYLRRALRDRRGSTQQLTISSSNERPPEAVDVS